jgi:DNA replication licensing factor MCM6
MSRFDLFFVILDECNEQVDRHLAEHIVGIHQNRDAAVTPEFSTEQIQRYIRFARTFRPEFTDEAKEVLVQRYKDLRADDAQGGVGRNSYRITVRQLESMIRLSEAIAKANCVEDITAEFVNEAFHLLRQSIISVEHDDVEVDDEEGQGEEDAVMEDGEVLRQAADVAQGVMPTADMDGDGDEAMEEDGETAGRQASTAPSAATAATAQQKQTISYDKYISIVNMLVSRVAEDETAGSGEGIEGDALVQWYLEQKEEELDSEEAYNTEMALARAARRRRLRLSMCCTPTVRSRKFELSRGYKY